MIRQDKKNRFKVAALALLLCLSISSFVYLNAVTTAGASGEQDIFVEEYEERRDILPDVQLLKTLMHKTLEFMTVAPRF